MNNMIGKMLDNRYELLEVIGSGVTKRKKFFHRE